MWCGGGWGNVRGKEDIFEEKRSGRTSIVFDEVIE